MDRTELDELLDRELKGLPLPRAPRTLLPRVLGATAGRVPGGAPSGWFTWPLGWRIASAAALVAAIAAAAFVLASPPQGVSEAARSAGEAAAVARVLWDAMVQPVATYIFIWGISLTLACAIAWAALEAALGGATHR
jgi:hypothetical protein